MKTKTRNPAILMAICAMLTTVFLAVPASAGSAQGVVNVNTATVEQLQFLPGIGLSKAKAIVDHRAKQPFATVEDLIKVKGIGNKLVEKIRDRVVVRGETTAKAPPKNATSRRKG